MASAQTSNIMLHGLTKTVFLEQNLTIFGFVSNAMPFVDLFWLWFRSSLFDFFFFNVQKEEFPRNHNSLEYCIPMTISGIISQAKKKISSFVECLIGNSFEFILLKNDNGQ